MGRELQITPFVRRSVQLDKGHLGFLGHNDYVEFRNLRVKEFAVAEANNIPPKGFKRLFNGENLEGWKGLVADPVKRAKMSKDELAAAQAKADAKARRMVKTPSDKPEEPAKPEAVRRRVLVTVTGKTTPEAFCARMTVTQAALRGQVVPVAW